MDDTATAEPQQIEFSDQFGALPWRRRKGKPVEILLVTSRISKHWLIPKGWRITGKSAARSAMQEALEEAGVRGDASKVPLGGYAYVKLMKDGSSVPCLVTVYGLRVRKLLDKWPEAHQRTRTWYGLAEAATMVNEPGLSAFLGSLAEETFKD